MTVTSLEGKKCADIRAGYCLQRVFALAYELLMRKINDELHTTSLRVAAAVSAIPVSGSR